MEQLVRQARSTVSEPRSDRADVSVSCLIVASLGGLLAAAAWPFWILASGALGMEGVLLAGFALLASAYALSRHTGRSAAEALILIGFGSVVIMIGAMFGLAAYASLSGV